MEETFDDQIKKIVIDKLNKKLRLIEEDYIEKTKHLSNNTEKSLEQELKTLI